MAPFSSLPENLLEAFDAACETADKAYAPYSRYKVGCALRLGSGKIVTGCNVENASYGATICAERTAIVSAVAAYGADRLDIQSVILVTQGPKPAPPCGMCLQVFQEFLRPETFIWLCTRDKKVLRVTLDDLLPIRFDPEQLEK